MGSINMPDDPGNQTVTLETLDGTLVTMTTSCFWVDHVNKCDVIGGDIDEAIVTSNGLLILLKEPFYVEMQSGDEQGSTFPKYTMVKCFKFSTFLI